MNESKKRERALQAELEESNCLCRDKDLYISELEGELQAKRKKIFTLSGQLEETEIELEKLQRKGENARTSQSHVVPSEQKIYIVIRLLLILTIQI